MRLISKNYKKGYIKAKIDDLDDLWYLNYVIEAGDTLKSLTFRKIKLGSDSERDGKVIKKPAIISIIVEKVEFARYSNILRVSGTISEAPEDIPLGSHHTLNIEEGSEFSLEKQKFLNYQIEKLEESSQEIKEKILVVVHDREDAAFALIKKYGFEILSELKGNPAKKAEMKSESSDFFSSIRSAIEEYDKRHDFSGIIIASPGFWKNYMQKEIGNLPVAKKISYATCSSSGESGINEVMRRPEVKAVLKQQKFAAETELVDLLLSEIGKQGKAEYGFGNVKSILQSGAISDMLVSDALIQKKRQDSCFQELEGMMKDAEAMGGKVHIVSSEHEGGKKLDGLGGIAAILRYKINY